MKKTLIFQRPSQVPSAARSVVWVFPFTCIDSSLLGTPEEWSETSPHQVLVSATLELVYSWNFATALGLDEEADIRRRDLMRVLFEFGKRFVIEKLKKTGTLELKEELALDTSNTKVPCPFDPSRILDPSGESFEAEIDEPTIQTSEQRRAREIAVFVDPSRIEELHKLESTQFDLAKLIRFCEELNVCYKNECYLAVAMLTRALIDHVPPIFGFGTFIEMLNHYAGTRSFKEQMEHLQNSSRKIADAHLHTPIRSKENLPNSTQVNFASDIDILLAEIVRILK